MLLLLAAPLNKLVAQVAAAYSCMLSGICKEGAAAKSAAGPSTAGTAMTCKAHVAVLFLGIPKLSKVQVMLRQHGAIMFVLCIGIPACIHAEV